MILTQPSRPEWQDRDYCPLKMTEGSEEDDSFDRRMMPFCIT